MNPKGVSWLTMHRTIPSFMIQGGGYNEKMIEKKGRPAIVNDPRLGTRRR